MALQLERIRTILRPWLQVRIPPEILDILTDEDFIIHFNDVAQDMNNVGALNIERFNQTLDDTIAEDSDVTNVLMAGVIERVIDIKYKTDGWRDVLWSHVSDRIMFKESADGVEVEVYYLKRPEDLDIAADEVDLPDAVLPEFIELVKAKLLANYTANNEVNYEELLQFYAIKAGNKIALPRIPGDTGLRREWFDQTGDDRLYVINEQFVTLDNWIVNASGVYVYVSD